MKYKAIIASDLHLGTKDSQAKEFIEYYKKYYFKNSTERNNYNNITII